MSERKETKLERIKSWINGDKQPIWNMQLQPTDRCNLRCRFCWRKEYTREFEEMEKEKWIQIVKEACEMGVKMITFVGGGEPTLRSDVILEASDIMKGYDIEGAIVTNGTVFDEEMIEKLVEREWEGVAFSINGAYADTDNYLRGREGTFQKAIENIKLFDRIKEERNTIYPKITIQMVITKYNYEEILPMYYLAEKMGVDIVLYRMVNEGGDMEKKFYIEQGALKVIEDQLAKVKELSQENEVEIKQEFDIEDIKKVLREELAEKEGEEAKKAFEDSEEAEDVDKPKEEIPCAKPFSEMVILADGTAHPCCVIAESKYKQNDLGMREIENIKGSKLLQIWNGEKLNRIREIMKQGNLPERCRRYCTLDMIYREKSGAIYEDKW